MTWLLRYALAVAHATCTAVVGIWLSHQNPPWWVTLPFLAMVVIPAVALQVGLSIRPKPPVVDCRTRSPDTEIDGQAMSTMWCDLPHGHEGAHKDRVAGYAWAEEEQRL